MPGLKPIFTSEGMAEADRHTFETLEVPAGHLMNNAALRIHDEMREFVTPRDRILVIAGGGNNGGDGIALATYLFRDGYDVNVQVVSTTPELKEPAALFANIAEKLGVPMERHVPRVFPAEIWDENWDYVVDALFGTGLQRALSREYVNLIGAMNEYCASRGAMLISIDTPSGFCASTGRIFGATANSDVIYTIEYDKLGFQNFATADIASNVQVLGIGFPAECAKLAAAHEVEMSDVQSILPERDRKSHKGTYGRVLIVGGSTGMTGAARMAARAAIRAGAGMAKLVVPEKLRPAVAASELEVMVEGATDTDTGSFSRLALHKLLELTDWADCVCIGCGIGRHPQTLELVRDFLTKCKLPIILDADGIYALKDLQGKIPDDCAVGITPHPGEFCAVSGVKREQLENDPFGLVREFAASRSCAVAFQAGKSFTADKLGRIYCIPTGNPGMATAGSGDVLAGAIAGMLAPAASRHKSEGGFDISESVCVALWAGQYLHGLAGDLAAEEIGLDGMIAGDILELLPHALDVIRRGEDSEL